MPVYVVSSSFSKQQSKLLLDCDTGDYKRSVEVGEALQQVDG